MKLDLQPTEYHPYVQQLGTLQAYKAGAGVIAEWFTTLEEARQRALKWHSFQLRYYKRDCPTRRDAARAVAVLQKDYPTSVGEEKLAKC